MWVFFLYNPIYIVLEIIVSLRYLKVCPLCNLFYGRVVRQYHNQNPHHYRLRRKKTRSNQFSIRLCDH
ncbi:hypothetical protein Hdeb2414_s1063g00977311 [Helianthus debilis subsp. tardiflorus]